MKEYLIKPCALAYLNQWHATDKRIVESIENVDSIGDLAKAIRTLAIKYQVIRTFQIKKIRDAHGEDEVNERWRQVARAVKAVNLDDQDHSKIVHRLADKLGSIFHMDGGSGKAESSLISAATKFLWFRGHTTIRIYDKRAVDALNPMQKMRAQAENRRSWLVGGDYEKYSCAWRQEYLACETKLVAAIMKLPQQLEWSFIPEGKNRSSALNELAKQRFRERVFDKYLWTLGERRKN